MRRSVGSKDRTHPVHRRAEPVIRVWDAAGTLCLEGPLSALRLPEAVVLELSVEFFQDPEPCFIHRGAVAARAVEELRRAVLPGGRVSLDTLPEPVRRYLGEYPAAAIEIRL